MRLIHISFFFNPLFLGAKQELQQSGVSRPQLAAAGWKVPPLFSLFPWIRDAHLLVQ
jgi:hypothetical protein